MLLASILWHLLGIWEVLCSEDNDDWYVPKSKRGFLYGSLTKFGNYTSKIFARMTSPIEKWEIRSKVRYRERIAQRYADDFKNTRWKSRETVVIFALSAVAMAAEQARRTNEGVFDTDSRIVGVDNRASVCMSDDIKDFQGEMREINATIKGFHGSKQYKLQVGTIRWNIEDDDGKVFPFTIPGSYYIPDGNVKLLSPQHWAQTRSSNFKRKSATCLTTCNSIRLTWDDKHHRTIPLTKGSNVGNLRLAPGYGAYNAFCTEAEVNDDLDEENPICMPSVVSDDEDDFSDDENESEEVYTSYRQVHPDKPREFVLSDKTPLPGEEPVRIEDEEEDRQPTNVAAEYLKYHIKYNHAPDNKIKEMARQGIIPRRLAKCDTPICTACMYGKATRRQWRHKIPASSKEPETPTKPGEVVSVDQMVSHTPGLIAQMTGFLLRKRYRYATVFVDNFSDLSFVYFQKEASAQETIEAKEAFERYAKIRGIKVDHYHADNGIFKAEKFVQACRKNGQGLSFAGVNAHHQNGRAERRIRTLQEMTRTSLIHAKRRWDDAITTNLWPYALRVSNDAYNNTPSLKDASRRTPHQIFTGTTVAENPKHWFHFGCPVFVLDNDLQAGRNIRNKWKSRSRMGLYMGRSPIHARNVALVLDIETGYVSPQFHVKMDSSFHSVKPSTRTEMIKSKWQAKTGFVRDTEQDDAQGSRNKTKTTRESRPRTNSEEKETMPASEGASSPSTEQESNRVGERETQEETQKIQSKTISATSRESTPSEQIPVRRSTRERMKPERFVAMMRAEHEDRTRNRQVPGELFCLEAMFPNDLIDPGQITAYAASSDPDTMYWHEAMRQPDAEKFREAATKEVKTQTEMGVYEIIKKSEVPRNESIIPSVWAMRRKRHILTSEIHKWKARLNYDGSKQVKGKDYDNTYAPVVGWSIVRLFLILVITLGWFTQQLDYVLAYPQAPLSRPKYMGLPKGFIVEGVEDAQECCLKVNRNIYGSCDASRLWYQHLSDKLKKIGFKKSAIDECVFYKGRVLYILYTDDSILAAPTQEEIAETIEAMKAIGLKVTNEGTLSDFVGVNITRNNDGTITLSQPKLIDQILGDMRLKGKEVKAKSTPMKSSAMLLRHLNSPPFDNHFHYRSIIGKLNYLEKGSRPDIAYAVHQCARFCENPREEHGKAVNWLCRYLKGTATKGLVLRPDDTKGLEVYVDASFVGDWDPKNALTDRDTARSRHGYMIFYNGCLIAHKSQMQTDIALSTTEAEFTGLSQALREVIPIMRLLKEMKENGFPILSSRADMKCRVFEDNSGAIELSTVFKARPRTKHINTRLWHFMSYVESGDIRIQACKSEDMPADILTKPVNEGNLHRHRLTVQGWQSIITASRVTFASHLERECSIPDSSVGRMIPKHGKNRDVLKSILRVKAQNKEKIQKIQNQDPKLSESKSRVKVIFRVTETRK